MAYNHEYPYVDPNRFNTDWALDKIKDLESRIVGIVEEASAIATENAKAYVDTRILDITSQFNALKSEIAAYQVDINQSITDIQNEFTLFKNAVNARLSMFETTLSSFESLIRSLVKSEETARNIAIQLMHDKILEEVGEGLVNLKVRNYFTGQLVSAQDMFDILAQYHLEGAYTYSTFYDLNLTYTQLYNKNITYRQLLEGDIE